MTISKRAIRPVFRIRFTPQSGMCGSIKGLTVTLGATSSATTASVGAVRVAGPIGVIGNFQVPFGKAVFAIEPLDQLADQFAGKGDFIESPALDSFMNFLCMNIRNAGHCGYSQV